MITGKRVENYHVLMRCNHVSVRKEEGGVKRAFLHYICVLFGNRRQWSYYQIRIAISHFIILMCFVHTVFQIS